MNVLHHMQSMIGHLNDVPVVHDVNQFLINQANSQTDEQVFVAETEEGAELGVYIDPAVLRRLSICNPFVQLCDANLADFCTALEGVSHFQYLVWCVENKRNVSLLELELQAEVDKYTMAQWLLLQQTQSRYQHGLHARLFSRVSFIKDLDATALQRYQEVNKLAARYCDHIDRQYLRCRLRRIDRWIRELREFYRCSHHAKLRRSLH